MATIFKKVGAKCPGAKCPWGKMSVGQNVLWAKCPLALFFFTAHLAGQVGHDELELLGCDAPLVILAEHPERLLQLTFL